MKIRSCEKVKISLLMLHSWRNSLAVNEKWEKCQRDLFVFELKWISVSKESGDRSERDRKSWTKLLLSKISLGFSLLCPFRPLNGLLWGLLTGGIIAPSLCLRPPKSVNKHFSKQNKTIQHQTSPNNNKHHDLPPHAMVWRIFTSAVEERCVCQSRAAPSCWYTQAGGLCEQTENAPKRCCVWGRGGLNCGGFSLCAVLKWILKRMLSSGKVPVQ